MKIIVVFAPEYKADFEEDGIYETEICSHVNVLFYKKPEHFLAFIPMKISGKTYSERKADLQEKAIQWSYAGGVANWSYSELSEIQSFFEVNGKRYGLLKEFRENAII